MFSTDRMKSSRKIIVSGLVILFLIVVLIFTRHHNARQPNDFRVSSDREIVKVYLSKPGFQTVELERKKSGLWTLNGQHGVNEISLRDLLQTLDLLTARQPVSRTIVDEVNQNLDEEGIMVTVVEKKPLINLFGTVRILPMRRTAIKFEIGQDASQGQGVYARKAGSKEPYLIHLPGTEVPLSGFFINEFAYWFDPVVVDLKAAEIKRVEIEKYFPERESLIIDNQGEKWVLTANRQIVNSERISSFSLNRFLNSFEELYFEKLLVGEDSINYGEMMANTKFMQINVVDKSGKITTMDFFQKKTEESQTDPDLFFIVVNNKTLATARYFVFNRIMKSNSYFLR